MSLSDDQKFRVNLALAELHEQCFTPEMRVTLVARHPVYAERWLVTGDDDHKEVAKLLVPAQAQLSLGQLVLALKRCDPNVSVRFDFCGLRPTHLDSYRGKFSELALGWAVEDYADKRIAGTVDGLLGRCEAAVGAPFAGHKGGDFVMTAETPVWASNPGYAGGTAVVGVEPHPVFGSVIRTKMIG